MYQHCIYINYYFHGMQCTHLDARSWCGKMIYFNNACSQENWYNIHVNTVYISIMIFIDGNAHTWMLEVGLEKRNISKIYVPKKYDIIYMSRLYIYQPCFPSMILRTRNEKFQSYMFPRKKESYIHQYCIYNNHDSHRWSCAEVDTRSCSEKKMNNTCSQNRMSHAICGWESCHTPIRHVP